MRVKRVGDSIYHTTEWRKLRHSYFISQHGLCERCSQPGDVVHHKIYITNDNVNDPNITLNQDNLELLCHDCHNKEHYRVDEPIKEGFAFDDEGNFIKLI